MGSQIITYQRIPDYLICIKSYGGIAEISEECKIFKGFGLCRFVLVYIFLRYAFQSAEPISIGIFRIAAYKKPVRCPLYAVYD